MHVRFIHTSKNLDYFFIQPKVYTLYKTLSNMASIHTTQLFVSILLVLISLTLFSLPQRSITKQRKQQQTGGSKDGDIRISLDDDDDDDMQPYLMFMVFMQAIAGLFSIAASSMIIASKLPQQQV